MNINRHNYEEYLLDFIEGNLSEEGVRAVNSFFEKNRDLKIEVEGILNCKLVTENHYFKNKEILKKDLATAIEGISKFEQLSVAFLENDISKAEELQLDTLIKTSESKLYEHKIIQQTKLYSNKDVEYPDKARLKHLQLGTTRKRIYYISSLAASIALFLGLLFQTNSENFSAAALKEYHSEIVTSRRPIKINKDKKSIESINKVTAVVTGTRSDTVKTYSNSHDIASISAKTIAKLETDKPLFVKDEILAQIGSQNAVNKPFEEDVEVKEYIDKTLQELGIEDNPEEKNILASVGKSVFQFVKRKFRKNIQIEKKEIEDGRKLYAIRAGSLEFYTSIKGKSKDKLTEENLIRKGE